MLRLGAGNSGNTRDLSTRPRHLSDVCLNYLGITCTTQ